MGGFGCLFLGGRNFEWLWFMGVGFVVFLGWGAFEFLRWVVGFVDFGIGLLRLFLGYYYVCVCGCGLFVGLGGWLGCFGFCFGLRILCCFVFGWLVCR